MNNGLSIDYTMDYDWANNIIILTATQGNLACSFPISMDYSIDCMDWVLEEVRLKFSKYHGG